MKRFSPEVIISVIVAPMLFWFLSFILSSYQTMAEVENNKGDIQEIKQDVKYIRNYLLENKK